MKGGRGFSIGIFACVVLFAAAAGLGAQRLNDAGGTTIDFARIDSYVRKLPKFASTQLLAKSLSQTAKTDWEKARAIYVWVCENIDYDTEEFFTGKSAAAGQDPFLSGKAVCGGYSDIVTELAAHLGLEAVKISGFSKGYGYSEGERFTRSDHAWNAIRIQGSWRLFDTTWGAGAIDDKKNYVPSFSAAWFAMDPELFLMTHFSEDSAWNLSGQKLTLERFASLHFIEPYVFEKLYEAGISVPEQKKLLIPNPGSINKDIWRIENMKKAGAGSADNLAAYARLKALPDQEYWKIIHMVERGYRIPDLLAISKLPLSDEEYSNAALLEKYGFTREALLGFMKKGALPQAYTAQGSLRAIEVPGAARLEIGREYTFAVAIEGAVKAALVCGEDFHPMTLAGGTFTLTLKPDKGPVALVANFAGQAENDYAYLLEYEAY